MKVIQQLTGLKPKLAEKAIITLNFKALYSHLHKDEYYKNYTKTTNCIYTHTLIYVYVYIYIIFLYNYYMFVYLYFIFYIFIYIYIFFFVFLFLLIVFFSVESNCE